MTAAPAGRVSDRAPAVRGLITDEKLCSLGMTELLTPPHQAAAGHSHTDKPYNALFNTCGLACVLWAVNIR